MASSWLGTRKTKPNTDVFVSGGAGVGGSGQSTCRCPTSVRSSVASGQNLGSSHTVSPAYRQVLIGVDAERPSSSVGAPHSFGPSIFAVQKYSFIAPTYAHSPSAAADAFFGGPPRS